MSKSNKIENENETDIQNPADEGSVTNANRKSKKVDEKNNQNVEVPQNTEVTADDATEDEKNLDNDVAEDEIKNLKDQLLRTLAENENLRKRTSKDIEQIKKYGHINFVRDLLSSVDNLNRAIKAVPKDRNNLEEPIKNLIIGVEIVLNEISSTLERNNIKQINPLDEKFDYNFHQAMYEAENSEKEPGTILEVIQTGYILYDRLVRPALVGISKKNKEKLDKKNNENN